MQREGWRICDSAFARSPEEMMSGEGAYLFGGRWNSPGTRMVYLGTSIAQAAFELLVHLRSADVLKHFSKMKVSFSPEHLLVLEEESLPASWRHHAMSSSVQATGDAWVESMASVALEVPSVAVPGASNYLINPAHPDFSKIQWGDVSLFTFDPRILKR